MPCLMFEMDEELSGYFPKACSDQQVSGSLSAVRGYLLFIDEVECLETDESCRFGEKGLKERLQNAWCFEQLLEERIVVHAASDAFNVSPEAILFQ